MVKRRDDRVRPARAVSEEKICFGAEMQNGIKFQQISPPFKLTPLSGDSYREGEAGILILILFYLFCSICSPIAARLIKPNVNAPLHTIRGFCYHQLKSAGPV